MGAGESLAFQEKTPPPLLYDQSAITDFHCLSRERETDADKQKDRQHVILQAGLHFT